MIIPLAESLSELAAALDAGRRPILFLDFDGTLVPLSDRPFECRIEPELRETLVILHETAGVPVSVISGRDLADLRPRVGIESLACAGNHGLEISGPGIQFVEPTAANRVDELAVIMNELTAALSGIPGTWVQNKTLTATVHVRQTPPERIAQVESIVHAVTAPHRSNDRFVLKPGKDVLEVRPQVDWHKGRAVEWLTAHYGAGGSEWLPIVLGDDLTDEDAFMAAANGITVLVGARRPTAARFHLDSPSDTAKFLHWLREQVRRAPSSPLPAPPQTVGRGRGDSATSQ